MPSITFDVGGISGIFEKDREAVILPEQSAGALAGAIKQFLEDPAPFKLRAQQARERVERDFTMTQRAEKLLKYYQTMP